MSALWQGGDANEQSLGCVCVRELFSHLRDSPRVLSLCCCIHAHFLYVTISAVTHPSETTVGLPSIASHMSIILYVSFIAPRSLLGACVACGCFPLNPSVICVYLCTEKYVCSGFDCQTIYWINNLSNQSQWHSSKGKSACLKFNRQSRRNSSDTPQVALHVHGSGSTFLCFLAKLPLPLRCTPQLPHTVITTSSSVQQRGNLIRQFFSLLVARNWIH